jgi:hypothetical protein
MKQGDGYHAVKETDDDDRVTHWIVVGYNHFAPYAGEMFRTKKAAEKFIVAEKLDVGDPKKCVFCCDPDTRVESVTREDENQVLLCFMNGLAEYNKIAEKLGLTRWQVLGAVHNINLESRQKTGKDIIITS